MRSAFTFLQVMERHDHMNVIFEGADVNSAKVHTNAGRETTSYRTQESAGKAETRGFALDISGTVMDNSAYAGHGRTAEEVMLAAGQEDITARRNYMAVMSNSMSDEDFARLQKEGFHPGSTDIKTVVTIVDHIKVALMKGGTQVTGYTDTVDQDVLREITGSEVFAQELAKQFSQHDVPITEENTEAVMEGWNTLQETGSLSEGSVKYMVENGLDPTPENLYTAKFSGPEDAGRQGKGYYAQGDVNGYYAKKPEDVDFQKLLPQVERFLQDAGYEVNSENLANAQWLIEKGIPLNEETYSLLADIKSLEYPITPETYMRAAADALSQGKAPVKADLSNVAGSYEKAAELAKQAAAIQDEAADLIRARDLPMTFRNLWMAQEILNQGADQVQNLLEGNENIKGRRLLEEIRLSMTIETNLKLLKKGFQIETAPIEELVDRLKQEEKSLTIALLGEKDEQIAAQKASQFKDTLETIVGIGNMPAATVAHIQRTDTLTQVYDQGAQRAAEYRKAGESYETMMTAPRKDMGDSIQKAFRNVDDILEDLELSATEANRRAVRILGYNSKEINPENIASIQEKDALLMSVIEEMKPGRILSMIREGINPTQMPLEELQEYLQQQEDAAQEIESYSRFLYKLEKQGGISEEERSAYIGVYRLVRQIEKADNAAVGAIWQTGAGFTLENLLTAVRSSKHKAMNYKVDDSFGGVQSKHTGVESITAQLEKAFAGNNINDLLPIRQELKEILEDAGSREAEQEFDKQLFEQVRAAVKPEDAVWQLLDSYGISVTADNLLAAGQMMKSPLDVWRKLLRNEDAESETEQQEPSAEGDLLSGSAGQDVIDSLTDAESAQKAYDSFGEMIKSMLEKRAFEQESGALDVREMSALYKQISFMGSMAKEENYEIPVEIDGLLTSINLKLVHDKQGESKVAIAFETQALGRTAAEFRMTGQGLSGLCICSQAEGTDILKDNQQAFAMRLKEEGIDAGDIYFATGESLDLTEFALKQAAGLTEGQKGSQELYKAAKAFIGYIQETAIEKGSIEYEDHV